jgi:hypothetical protein
MSTESRASSEDFREMITIPHAMDDQKLGFDFDDLT